jgi:putative ABC transport system substrate-binding protein
MRRREFIAGLGSTVAWPAAARAQQRGLPVVAFINASSPEASAHFAAAFRAGLSEFGYFDEQNVAIEYHWLEGRYDRLPALLTELVRRRVAVIATPGSSQVAAAAKAATTTIPIVFGVGDDPVALGLVASLSQPGGNATGANFFSIEVLSKLLGLLHQLVPNAKRMAILVNPGSPASTEATLRALHDAAGAIGLAIEVLKASTGREIEEVFSTLGRKGIEAVLVGPESYFASRRVALATLSARYGIPTATTSRDFVEVGGLMSYGTDVSNMFRQVGAYTGQILHGAKPADLPVVQSTRFEFAVNALTARALGIEVSPGLLASADTVIE